MIEELLKNWHIGPIETIEPTPLGGGRTWFIKTSADGEFVLKESDPVRAGREHKYQGYLSKTAVPVPLAIKSLTGEWAVEYGIDKVCCLYPKLPGQVITEYDAADSTKRAKGFGRAIGLLHACFLEIDHQGCDREMDLLGQLQEWAVPRIKKEGTALDVRAIIQIWESVEARLISLCTAMPPQLIHRDAHISNMLFDAGKLSGFLDFEMATRGQRLFDVCYCGSCLLVDGFDDPEKVEQWPAMFQSLVDGYQEYCPLTSLECNSMYEMLVAIELIFLAFWLDHQDVDNAQQIERLLGWLKKHKDSLFVQW